MSEQNNDENKALFSNLILNLELIDIRFVDMHTQLLADPTPGNELNMHWTQQFADDDPGREENSMTFRPRYEINITQGETPIFHAVYITLVRFRIKDTAVVDEAWNNPEVRDVFQKKQILRTMWTILRGQLMDGMNRHSLTPIPMPWLHG